MPDWSRKLGIVVFVEQMDLACCLQHLVKRRQIEDAPIGDIHTSLCVCIRSVGTGTTVVAVFLSDYRPSLHLANQMSKA